MLRLSDREIYDAAEKAVRYFAGRVFPGFFREDDLNQIVVDTAESVWLNRGKYDESRAKVSTWIGKIAKNAVLDAVAKEKRYRSHFITFNLKDRVNDEGDAVGFTPVDTVETDAWLIATDTELALRSSVKGDRQIRIFNGLASGLDSAEIAEIEGVEPSKIYTPVSRLRSDLRKKYYSAA